MISWHIWQALRQPPRGHRLFQRVYAGPQTLQALISNRLLVGSIAIIGIAAFVSREFSSILSYLILLVIPIMAANYVFTGAIYGLRWAIGSGQSIAALRRSSLYDLLALTPPGALGINWAVSTGTFYKSLGSTHLDLQSLWPMRMFMVLPLTIFLSLRADPGGEFYRLQTMLVMGLYLGLMIAWFRLEDIQSIILGGLIGMLIPLYTRHRLEVHFGTAVGYIGIQVLLYTAGVLLLAVLFPALYGALGWQGWFASFSRPALTVAFIFAARESVINFIWLRLTDQMRAPRNFRLNARQRV